MFIMSATNENTPLPTPKFNVIAAPPNTVENYKKRFTRSQIKKIVNDTKKKETKVADNNYTPLKNRRCCVNKCKNDYKSCELFPFPNDKRLHRWKEVTGVAKGRQRKYRHLYICVEHFRDEDLIIVRKKRTLSKTAIPSEKLPDPILGSCYDETLRNLSDTALKLDDTLKEIELYKKHKGKTYNDLLLNLYIAHPNAYKLLEKPFNLMELSKLKQLLLKFKSVNPIITKKLAVMTPKQKVCILSHGKVLITPKVCYDQKFDKLIGLVSSEFDIRSSPADAAHFFVLSGVYEPWHILLDVIYIDEKKNKRKHCIGGIADNLQEKELRSIVKVLILLPEYTIAPDYVYTPKLNQYRMFQFQVLDAFKMIRQMVILFDLQFLLRVLFYSFKRVFYMIPEPTALVPVLLSHLTELLMKDGQSKCPLLPKLTMFHVEPRSFEELKFETVLEIFSKNTVSALRCYIELGFIPKEAAGMLTFIEKISLLIDVCKGKVLDQREILLILSDVERMLSKLKVSTVKSNIDIDPEHTAITYLIVTIKSLTDLFVDNPELFAAVSKQLINNYTNKFSEKVREKCKAEQLTAEIVSDTFRRCNIDNLLKPLNRIKVNFIDALDLLIEYLRSDIPSTIFMKSTIELEIKPSEYKIYFSDRADKLVYISGYLLKKCAEKHCCDDFKKYLENTNNYSVSSLIYDVASGDCLLPKNDFIDYIELLEMMFLHYFPKYKTGLVANVMKALKTVNFVAPCSCFPIYYMIQLFVCIRMEHILKCSNLEIKLKKRLQLDPFSLFKTTN